MCLKLGVNGGIVKSLSNPWTLIGVSLYGLSFLCWLEVLAAWPLSRAYPVLALNFGLVAFFAAVFLKEPLTPMQVAGTLLCAAGVALIGAGR
ncbi:EamA family transporter [Thermacetogenium phaeum]|nr:EamA family transporter [Thermacetogenium phaeum]